MPNENSSSWRDACNILIRNGEVHSIRLTDSNLAESFDVDIWRGMGEAIGRFDSLKVLELHRAGLKAEQLGALFDEQHNCPIESLNLRWNDFGTEGLSAILPFLRSRTKLRSLNLENTRIDDEGVRIVAEEVLGHVPIEVLHLGYNGLSFGDAGIEVLLRGSNSAHLIELNLFNFDGILFGDRSFEAIRNFLSRDDTALQSFAMNCWREQYRGQWLVESISKQSQLMKVVFYGPCGGRFNDRNMTSSKWMRSALAMLVIDQSSFDTICESNHQLHSIGESTEIVLAGYRDGSLEKAFAINARSKDGDSTATRMRCKLRTFFFQGDFDIQPFTDLDVGLMPFVLELVTRSEVRVKEDDGDKFYTVCNGDINSVYRLIRNCRPEMFTFPRPKWTMQELESKVQLLEARIAALQVENAHLKRTGSVLPNKRTK